MCACGGIGRHLVLVLVGIKKSGRFLYRDEVHSIQSARVAELVDALVLGTSGVTRGGSSPLARTLN